jgi:hypothetical protein
MPPRLSALVLCCAAAALAGCGSASTSGTTNAIDQHTHPSHAVFVHSLILECQAGNAAIADAHGNPAKITAIINSYVPKFKALSTTGALEITYRRFLATIEAELAALRTGNASGLKAAQAAGRKYAQELGASACAGK